MKGEQFYGKTKPRNPRATEEPERRSLSHESEEIQDAVSDLAL
jgi:hypothetical protein